MLRKSLDCRWRSSGAHMKIERRSDMTQHESFDLLCCHKTKRKIFHLTQYILSIQNAWWKKSWSIYFNVTLCTHIRNALWNISHAFDDNFHDFLSKFFSKFLFFIVAYIFTCNLSHVHTKINFLQCISAFIVMRLTSFQYVEKKSSLSNLITFTLHENMSRVIALMCASTSFFYLFIIFSFTFHPPPHRYHLFRLRVMWKLSRSNA